MTKKQFQDGGKVPSWKDVSGNASHLHAESISTQPVYRESVMSDAERLAIRIGAWAMDLDEGDRIIGASQDMREAATLLRAQSARIAALEDALRDCADDLEAELLSKGVYDTPRKMERDMQPVVAARLVLGKGSE